MRKHIRTIHEDHRDYKCEFCTKSFSRADHLMKHIHSFHKGNKDHKCESCGKSFSTTSYLKQHIHTIHGMKAAKITNVNLVENHFLKGEILGNIST